MARAAVAALILSLASLAGPGWATADEQVELTIAQTRQLAAEALRQNRPDLTIAAARGLLQANPEDGSAYFLIATARLLKAQPSRARRAASQSYRHSVTETQRFEAARLAARAAYDEGRMTLSQVWLRRAALSAPTDQATDVTADDYAFVRAQNPWQLQLRFGIRPSSNVNNGSDDSQIELDGGLGVGTLSPDAQALSGTIATTDVQLSYRLNGTAKQRTDLALRVFSREVRLSGEAKDKAPDAEGSDFSSALIETSLRHAFSLGDGAGSMAVRGGLGQAWWAHDPRYRYGFASLSRTVPINENTAVTGWVRRELRFSESDTITDEAITSLSASLRHIRPNGDALRTSLSWRTSDTDSVNSTGTSWTAEIGYTLAETIQSVQFSGSLGIGQSHYPDYTLAIFGTPDGGREDEAIFGEVQMMFTDFDYAGFAPTLTLRAAQTDSNVSRFDTTEYSLSLGIRSLF